MGENVEAPMIVVMETCHAGAGFWLVENLEKQIPHRLKSVRDDQNKENLVRRTGRRAPSKPGLKRTPQTHAEPAPKFFIPFSSWPR